MRVAALAMTLALAAAAPWTAAAQGVEGGTAADAAAEKERPLSREIVSMVQRRLNALGYQAGLPDGVFGRQTRRALTAWQTDIGLEPTGNLSYEDYKLLETDRVAPGELGPAPKAAAPTPAKKPVALPAPSERVRRAQQALAATGYDPGPVDGILGPRTRRAILAYQRDHDLEASGNVSDDLLASLASRSPRMPLQMAMGDEEPLLGETGRLPPYVAEVQRQLAEHGYYGGAATGDVDRRLRSAIREYQRDAGLPVTGEVSEALLDHLRYARPEIVKETRASR